jgi:hypothetical protein
MATWAPNRGQTTQQAQAAANNSPVYRQSMGFATGQAQSQQSPYSGSTPYQKNPAGDFSAYSPSSNTTRTQTYRQGSSPFAQSPQMPAGQQDGNWANYASPQRPSPFQATYGSPMGGQYEQPNFAQRDAFIQNINNQMAPYMTGQASGAPQFNFNQAWSNAGQMVNDGWQNPFAAVSQQSFPSQYQGLSMAGPGVQGFPDPPQESQENFQPPRQANQAARPYQQAGYSSPEGKAVNSLFRSTPGNFNRTDGRMVRSGVESAASAIGFWGLEGKQKSEMLALGQIEDFKQQYTKTARGVNALAARGNLSRAEADEQLRAAKRKLDLLSAREWERADRSGQQPSTPSGIRARGPGDPPDIAAPRTRYQREMDIINNQQGGRPMTAGRATSEAEQRIADAIKRSPSVQSDLARSRESMQRPTQTPARFQPNASQMVAGMVQPTGATGYGAGSGQGGPNPGAIGYTQQRFQLPRALGRKRGLGTSSGRSPVYI